MRSFLDCIINIRRTVGIEDPKGTKEAIKRYMATMRQKFKQNWKSEAVEKAAKRRVTETDRANLEL